MTSTMSRILSEQKSAADLVLSGHPDQRGLISCVEDLTPFAGVGSEVCGALATGRRGIGIELKPSYYRQLIQNVRLNPWYEESDQQELFTEEEAEVETV